LVYLNLIVIAGQNILSLMLGGSSRPRRGRWLFSLTKF